MLVGQAHVALLEREQELHVAAVALTEAAAGEGAALLVQGPAGIGKTRLLEAVVEQAAARGFDVHGARGDELSGPPGASAHPAAVALQASDLRWSG